MNKEIWDCFFGVDDARAVKGFFCFVIEFLGNHFRSWGRDLRFFWTDQSCCFQILTESLGYWTNEATNSTQTNTDKQKKRYNEEKIEECFHKKGHPLSSIPQNPPCKFLPGMHLKPPQLFFFKNLFHPCKRFQSHFRFSFVRLWKPSFQSFFSTS